MKDKVILAGDIGGTNTRLGIFSTQNGPSRPLVKQSYPSQEFDGLEDIILSFLAKHEFNVNRACFGVAGPVKNNSALITNLPWLIDGNDLQKKTAIEEVILLNDIEAMAYAIPMLEGDNIETISQGVTKENGVKALIAPGTGLGTVFLTSEGGKYRAHCSEGGHTEFGPRNDVEVDLLNYLRKKYAHVSYERVCSGMGLPNLFAFFRDTKRFSVPTPLARALMEAEDVTPVIVEAAIKEPEKHPICVAVVELFTSILAAQAGNLALTVSCYGGMYIGGGIPPRIASYIRHNQFVTTFRDKGRLSSMIADIPIHLITHPDIAITGAACRGMGL